MIPVLQVFLLSQVNFSCVSALFGACTFCNGDGGMSLSVAWIPYYPGDDERTRGRVGKFIIQDMVVIADGMPELFVACLIAMVMVRVATSNLVL